MMDFMAVVEWSALHRRCRLTDNQELHQSGAELLPPFVTPEVRINKGGYWVRGGSKIGLLVWYLNMVYYGLL